MGGGAYKQVSYGFNPMGTTAAVAAQQSVRGVETTVEKAPQRVASRSCAFLFDILQGEVDVEHPKEKVVQPDRLDTELMRR